MNLEIHPDARQNYDRQGELLVTRIRERPEELKLENSEVNPDLYIDSSVTITGEVTTGWLDSDGNVTAQAFYEGQQMFGLFGEDYADLVRLAEKVQKSIRPHDVA